jgi:protein-tyrosine phosphatase
MNLFGSPSTEILTVCTANICRSPMAEGLLREELKLRAINRKVVVKSAGTHVTRPGRAPDTRSQRVCAREGIDIRKSRSRQVTGEDFKRFSYILAMDQRNYQWLCESSPIAYRGRISLLGSWAAGEKVGEIPDPYYGSPAGFEAVLAQLHLCIDGFLAYFVGQEPLGEE